MLSPVDVFKHLADDTRLGMLLLISQHGSLCVCDLQQALALSQPKISRHLALLRQGKLLQDERRGKWVHYQLHSELPAWLRDLLCLLASEQGDYLASSLARLTQNQEGCQ